MLEPLPHLALARAARGFMPEDEGAAPAPRCARERLAARPGARGRHLLRQVGGLPRRRRPRASAAPCSPSTTTAARRRTRPAGSTTTPTLVDPRLGRDGHPAGLPAHDRARRPRGRGRRRRRRARRRSPRTGARRSSLLFIDGGHGDEPAQTDYTGWAPLGDAAAALLAIHDVFPDPADGGRPPYRRLPARAGERRLHRGRGASGSMRVLRAYVRRRPATRVG